MIDGTINEQENQQTLKFIQSRASGKSEKNIVKVTPKSRLDCPQFYYLFNYMSPIRFYSLSDKIITNCRIQARERGKKELKVARDLNADNAIVLAQ